MAQGRAADPALRPAPRRQHLPHRPRQHRRPRRARRLRATTPTSASGCPRRSRTADGTLYAAWMFRKQTVHDVAFTLGAGPELHHLGFAVPESHHILSLCDTHRRARPRRTTSSAGPAATACPTPSTSTCATTTATGSRSTRRTTSPAIPTTSRCAGTSTTSGAATSGPTRSCPAGTSARRRSSTSTGGRCRSSSRSRPSGPSPSAPTGSGPSSTGRRRSPAGGRGCLTPSRRRPAARSTTTSTRSRADYLRDPYAVAARVRESTPVFYAADARHVGGVPHGRRRGRVQRPRDVLRAASSRTRCSRSARPPAPSSPRASTRCR